MSHISAQRKQAMSVFLHRHRYESNGSPSPRMSTAGPKRCSISCGSSSYGRLRSMRQCVASSRKRKMPMFAGLPLSPVPRMPTSTARQMKMIVTTVPLRTLRRLLASASRMKPMSASTAMTNHHGVQSGDVSSKAKVTATTMAGARPTTKAGIIQRTVRGWRPNSSSVCSESKAEIWLRRRPCTLMACVLLFFLLFFSLRWRWWRWRRLRCFFFFFLPSPPSAEAAWSSSLSLSLSDSDSDSDEASDSSSLEALCLWRLL
mmetsp:Transcript_53648/g.164988  ORF Transcript_53648/g.164988 Transcript_53648/m.164988 type:complete len:260 (-) Transcript_53648:1274-2053(-)